MHNSSDRPVPTWYAPTWYSHSALQTSTSTFAPSPQPGCSASSPAEPVVGVAMLTSEGLCMGVALLPLLWSYLCHTTVRLFCDAVAPHDLSMLVYNWA